MDHVSEASQHVATPILVVEDDRALGAFLVLALQRETRYHALLVPNGFQALACVKTLVPHLFILDDQLLDMTGIELYDHFHTQKGLQHIPSLFLSANVPMKEIEQRQAYHLTKPFGLDEFLQMVQTIVGD